MAYNKLSENGDDDGDDKDNADTILKETTQG